MPKRRAKSSNGPPGPNGDDPNGDAWADGAGWVVKMFTTAGATRSTRSAYPAVAALATPVHIRSPAPATAAIPRRRTFGAVAGAASPRAGLQRVPVTAFMGLSPSNGFDGRPPSLTLEDGAAVLHPPCRGMNNCSCGADYGPLRWIVPRPETS